MTKAPRNSSSQPRPDHLTLPKSKAGTSAPEQQGKAQLVRLYLRNRSEAGRLTAQESASRRGTKHAGECGELTGPSRRCSGSPDRRPVAQDLHGYHRSAPPLQNVICKGPRGRSQPPGACSHYPKRGDCHVGPGWLHQLRPGSPLPTGGGDIGRACPSLGHRPQLRTQRTELRNTSSHTRAGSSPCVRAVLSNSGPLCARFGGRAEWQTADGASVPGGAAT